MLVIEADSMTNFMDNYTMRNAAVCQRHGLGACAEHPNSTVAASALEYVDEVARVIQTYFSENEAGLLLPFIKSPCDYVSLLKAVASVYMIGHPSAWPSLVWVPNCLSWIPSVRTSITS